MRQRQTSVMVFSMVMIVMAVLYLALPSDPISATLKRVIYGFDNAFTSVIDEQQVDTESQNKIADLEAQNRRLKDDLAFVESQNRSFLSGNVVSKSVQNYRSTIDVDIGSDAAVEVGQAAMSDGQLVGRVVQVSSNRARILTIFDPDFRAAALVDGTRLEGLVRHVPGGAVIEQLPGEIRQSESTTRVVTSGLGGVFPPGLFIGNVGDDISDDNAIFKEYSLRSTIDISSVREVTLLQ